MSEPERVRTTEFCNKIKGFINSILILMSAIFGSFYILLPLLPLMFFNHTLWRKVVDRLVGFWLILPSGLVEFIYRIRLTVTGDKIEPNEPALIIMNHRTRLDWLFFWNALLRIDPWLLTSEKISLKGILKYLPGAGWAMSCSMFIFLDRSFENDRIRIETLLNYYRSSGNNYQLLLFPEGTDKCEFATERSRKFALKKGLAHYSHVLHPKTTGFAYIVGKMREFHYIKNVYDVTVAYADAIVQSELDLFCFGACPRDIHFDVRKIDIDTLPSNKEGLSEWLTNLWRQKEERLERFYSEKCVEKRHLDTQNNAHYFEITPDKRTVQVCVVAFWLFLTAIWGFTFWKYRSQLILAAFAFIIFIASQIFYGGMEWIAVWIAADNNNHFQKVQSCSTTTSSCSEVRDSLLKEN